MYNEFNTMVTCRDLIEHDNIKLNDDQLFALALFHVLRTHYDLKREVSPTIFNYEVKANKLRADDSLYIKITNIIRYNKN